MGTISEQAGARQLVSAEADPKGARLKAVCQPPLMEGTCPTRAPGRLDSVVVPGGQRRGKSPVIYKLCSNRHFPSLVGFPIHEKFY